MTTEVQNDKEVLLNAVRYRIIGPVLVSNISGYPEKQIIGDYGRDSQRNISVFTWNDQRGGQGVHRMRLDQGDRSQETDLDISHQGHLTKKGLLSGFAVPAVTGLPIISQLGALLVAAHDLIVYSNNGGAWTNRHTLAATPVDVRNGAIGTTEYLVFPYTSGYAFASAIGSWTNRTKNVVNVEFWDDRLWGIDATGQLWYTFTPGSAEVNDAILPLAVNEVVTGLFQARARANNGAFILYATTSKSLWLHDIGNRKFVRVAEIDLPENNVMAHERPATVWHEKIYLAAGRSIIEYDPINLTVNEIGFDKDDGLPATRDGLVSTLANSFHFLFAGTTPVSTNDRAMVLQWDGRGWSTIWDIANPSPARVESLYTTSGLTNNTPDRLYLSSSTSVFFIRLNNSSTRTVNIDDWTYNFSGPVNRIRNRHVYPVFDAGQNDLPKVLLRVLVEAQDLSSTVTIRVFVAFDGATETLLTDTQTADASFSAASDHIFVSGVTTFSFPTVATPTGTQFRNLQVAIELDNVTTGPNSADCLAVSLEYFKVLDEKLGFDFDIDLEADGPGGSPAEQRVTLLTAQASAILIPFTFREDTGNRTYYVKMKPPGGGPEETGHDETGRIHVHCEEL